MNRIIITLITMLLVTTAFAQSEQRTDNEKRQRMLDVALMDLILDYGEDSEEQLCDKDSTFSANIHEILFTSKEPVHTLKVRSTVEWKAICPEWCTVEPVLGNGDAEITFRIKKEALKANVYCADFLKIKGRGKEDPIRILLLYYPEK